MASSISRMWINAPSTHSLFHKMHGTNVLATPEGPGFYRVYFLSGPVRSMRVPGMTLSLGWKETT